MKLRNMAVAVLRNGDDFLLMKRSETRRFAPGVWAGVGGHMEPDEINDPECAVLRELLEETGIPACDIRNLRLRMIVMRRFEEEIRVSHVFLGETDRRDVIDTDEGELHWIPREALLDRRLSAMNRLVLERVRDETGPACEVEVGALVLQNGEHCISWSPLTHFEGV